MNIRKDFSIVRMTELGHRLLREVVESPSLEVFKRHLDISTGCGRSCWRKRIVNDGCHSNFHKHNILCLCGKYICMYIYIGDVCTCVYICTDMFNINEHVPK